MFHNRSTLACTVLLAVLLLAVPALQAQAVGTIRGSVTDETGGVLPGVEVTITNTDTSNTRLSVTNDLGRYRAPNLPLGTYTVSAELTGFKTSTISDIHLTVGAQITANLQLQIGEVTEQVTVTGGGELVDTTSITMQSLVDEVKIRELPLNGRDYLQLALLQPGTVQMRGQRQVRISPQTGTGLNMSISGGRPNSNTFQLDGITVNDAAGSSPGSVFGANLGVDAIREFAVMSSTYGAEYGRGAGGVVNSVIRSGTNSFHGSLHYFHRNKALDARNFFDFQEEEPPHFRKHQYGATAGGPIARDRVFIFGAWEGVRQFREETQVANVPTAAATSGNLVGADGLPGTADDINIPIDPAYAPFLSAWPEPNQNIEGDFGELAHAPGFKINADFFTLRSDVQVTDATNASFSYLIEDGAINQRDSLNLSSLRSFSRRQLIAANVVSVISPSVINTVRVGYSRPYGATGSQTSDIELFNNPSPELSFIPQRPPGIIAVPGLDRFFTGFESEDTEGLLMQSTQVFEDVGWTVGSHDLKFGFNVEFDAPRIDAANRENGEFRFDDFEAFLRNEPNRFRGQFPGSDTRRFFRQNLWGAYFQDNIQVLENLSVNFGIRWEFAEDIQEMDGQSVRTFFADDYATGSFEDWVLGEGFFGEMPRYEIGNFAPRFGFAWDVFNDGKTSIRGGFGIYGDLILTPFLNLPGLRTPPFFSRGTFSGDAARAALLGTFPTGGFDAFVNSLTPTLSVDPIERNPPQPYRMQFNLNLQQELARNTVASIGYVGALGRNFGHVQRDVNLAFHEIRDNRVFHASGQPRRNPNFNRMGGRQFNSSNWYNALQLGVNRRFTEGFRAQASYTWSKALDEGSTVFSTNQFDTSIPNPVPDISEFNKANAAFDIRQQFVLNGTIDMPSPADGAAAHWLGGWQVGGILTLVSGVPVTPRQDNDRMESLAGDGGNQIGARPDLRPGAEIGADPPASADKRLIFDPGAFLPAAILCNDGTTTNGDCDANGGKAGGFAGNLGRTTVIGDGLVTFDLVLTKNTHLTEDVNLQFRAEFFNLANNVNMDSPNSNIVVFSGRNGDELVNNAGNASRTLSRSREIQLGLKLIW